MQVQGAKAAKTLEKLVGDKIYDLKYYWTDKFEIDGIPVVISRTGWTAVQGFEINLLGYEEGGKLWDAVFAAGEEFNIRPIAPCEARRIEAGIFNWGSDIRLGDTPFHVMGLERLVEEQSQDYIGKAALEELRTKGVDRKLVGIEFPDQPELRAELSEYWKAYKDGKEVGRVTDAVWSPKLETNIGYVWVPIGLAEPGNDLEIVTHEGEKLHGRTAAIPFVDQRKEVPAANLR
jgi:aminomethyltransferase